MMCDGIGLCKWTSYLELNAEKHLPTVELVVGMGKVSSICCGSVLESCHFKAIESCFRATCRVSLSALALVFWTQTCGSLVSNLWKRTTLPSVILGFIPTLSFSPLMILGVFSYLRV